MKTCVNCRRKQSQWASRYGFEVEGRVYCCMGCGFSGCTCAEARAPRQKVQISLAPVVD